jgi:hypothetical protein
MGQHVVQAHLLRCWKTGASDRLSDIVVDCSRSARGKPSLIKIERVAANDRSAGGRRGDAEVISRVDLRTSMSVGFNFIEKEQQKAERHD